MRVVRAFCARGNVNDLVMTDARAQVLPSPGPLSLEIPLFSSGPGDKVGCGNDLCPGRVLGRSEPLLVILAFFLTTFGLINQPNTVFSTKLRQDRGIIDILVHDIYINSHIKYTEMFLGKK